MLQAEKIKDLAVTALEDMKAMDMVVLDVRNMTGITDYMIIASATSGRHLKALTDAVVEQSRLAGHRPLGVEGELTGEWAVVDLGDVIVHVMMPKARDFYQLEKLWRVEALPAAEQDT